MNKILYAISMAVISSTAHTAPINYLELTGGTFSMDGGINTYEIIPGEFASMTIGGYDPGYRISTDKTRNVVGYFEFGNFGPMFITTALNSSEGFSGYRPVSGDITDGNLTLDLDAWQYELSLLFGNQGNTDACVISFDLEERCTSGETVTTYNPDSGEFTASWERVDTNGYWQGNVGTWNITGYVSAVPIPAAIWLFGSGLLGLIGFSRFN